MKRHISRRTLVATGLGALCSGRVSLADEKKPTTGGNDPVKFLKEATKKYDKAKTVLQAEYREALARAIPLADKVEAFLLDFEPSGDLTTGSDPMIAGSDPFSEDNAPKFPIWPAQRTTKILKRIEVKEGSARELKRLIAVTLRVGDSGDQALCHFPIHGLRFYKGDALLYGTSLCWKCFNYFVQYPDDFNTAEFHGFKNAPLEKLMNSLVPIPEAELKRFEEKSPQSAK